MYAPAQTYRLTLTKREKEVLACIKEGLSIKQAADKLSIAENTVANHRKNILLKTGAKSSADMTIRNMSSYLN